MAQGNQPLPSKEQALFKQLVKLYEDKQAKKALKVADQILKKFPDHGETLAMKGLTMSTMGPDRKEEAYALVKKGLKADLKSHVCWHVHGLLCRTVDKDYKEAARYYQYALRLDPENMQIQRDLATLQIQMRDLAGFAESRQRLLALKPSNRSNWITFALAQHANKAYDVAIQVLQSYESTLQEVPPSEAYEHSELLLYKALLLDEAGQLEEALKVLDTQQDKLKDKLGMLEHRASLLLRMGRSADAEAQYRGLLALNPDHYRWHEGLQAALGLRDPSTVTPPTASASGPAAGQGGAGGRQSLAGQQLSQQQRAGLAQLYQALAGQYPRSSACQRIPLDFLQGEAFVAAADAYVRKYLTKGIPSLFMDLKPLYSDADKAAALGSLFESYNTSLKANGCFPTSASANSNGHSQQESPQTRVWVLYHLAQHYDHLGDHTHGLELLHEAQQHTPTLIELYTTTSKLLRHAGDMLGAAEAAEVARRGDLSDRYLNSMAVKALLRANKVDAAEKTAALFTRETDSPGGGVSALYDMQHMWFETKAGAAHMRLGEHGKALKKLTAVLRHFEDIHEDQFDFHGYCVRKTTLRAYVAMLRWEDNLYAHGFYLKAAAGAITTYLALADKPTAAQQEAAEEALLASMSAEERKKYKLKKKKEEKKAEAARAAEVAAKEAAAKEAAAAKEHGKDKKKPGQAGADRKQDDDPHGDKLAACEDPLGAASKLVVGLKAHAPGVLDTHLLAAQVYCRRGKLLLALAAVQQAVRLGGPSHPQVHEAIVRFCPAATAPPSADQPALHPTVSRLLSEGVAALLQGAPDVAAYNNHWVSTHGQSSLRHRMAGARCLVQLGGAGAREQAVQLVLGAAATPGKAPGTHAECLAAEELLTGPALADTAAGDKWRAACQAAFPYSRHFGGSSVLPLEQGFEFDNLTEAFGRLAF